MRFVVLLCILFSSVAQIRAEHSSYSFYHISTQDGLSASNVKAILQDSYGFMWFGTKNGLNRYDGNSIVRFNCDDLKQGVSNHNISALYEDSDKGLWIGTDRGVYRYDLRKDIFDFISLKSEEGVSMDNWVSNIVGDQDGNVWIVIPDQGVFRYKNQKLSFYRISQQFKTESPNSICVCSDGAIYVGTWNVGLFKYDEKKNQFDQISQDSKGRSLLGLEINMLFQQENYLLVSLQSGSVKKYDYKNNVLEDLPLLQDGHTIVRNAMAFNGKIWVGTQDGLYILDEKTGSVENLKQNLLQPFSLSDDIIYTMYQDRSGGLWLGTMFGGVSYLPVRDFTFETFLSVDEHLSSGKQRIRGLVQDEKGQIWIGTESEGVSVFNPQSGKILPYVPAGKGLTVGMWSYGGKVFCGWYKQGLGVIDNTGFVNYSPQQLGIEEGSVYAFFIDSQGTRWIGTGWGLYKATSGSMAFSKVEATGYDWIFDIMESDDGTLWIASMGSGLWKYNRETDTYKKYIHQDGNEKSLSSNSISSIMQDSKGTLWFSTDRGGICRYNLSTDDFTSFSLKEGLPDDVAYKILEDASGNLWFGTNQGLLRFNPNDGGVRTFTVKDGLLENQFNYGAAVKGKDGKFYFGSIGGLVAFNPDVAEKKDQSPSVYISQFGIYNKPITLHTPESPLTTSIIETEEISLPYNQSNISMNISLLSYFSSEGKHFYYRLLPADKDWISSNNSSHVSYANLSPGEYVFQVKSGIDAEGGTESILIRSLRICILPPWWKSVWAYWTYVLGIMISAGGWFFWYRARKNKELAEKQHLFEVEKEKELGQMKIDFFTEIAHEIRTPLTLINGPLEVIQEMHIQDSKLVKNLQVISSNAKRLLNLTAQLLDFQKMGAYKLELNYELVNVSLLLKETIERFEPTIVHENKELSVAIPEKEIQACIDREAITKIISNLLNNARKYGKKHVRVELTANSFDFTLKVTSDGEKIASENEKKIFEPFYQIGKKEHKEKEGGVGIGLPLSRSLTLLHRGDLYLEPDANENTFVLCIPLNMSSSADMRNVEMEHKDVLLRESVTEDQVDTTGYTLLVVEDDKSILEFMKERLGECFLVETAGNGAEALDVLKRERIDLVISDVMMPVMDGYQLCSHIKEDINLCHIPVIFLTAKNDLNSKLNGLKVGGEAYIEKPFSFEYLKNQVMALLSNRRKEREAFLKRPFFPVNNMQLSKEDEDFMKKVLEIIDGNIADDKFNVERLADLLSMSRSNLLRKIKTLFNLSPVDFIRLIRLKKAAQLIQEGEFRIAEVGYMVGFSSPSYFTRMFVKQFGMAPKEFEKQVRQLRKQG
jgi:two-component system sensor histidine kinase/response regulator